MSASLSQQEVLRIAELARLALTPDEVELFAHQLGDILGYVEQIRAVDTSGVTPTAHGLTRPLERPDTPRPTLPRAEALAGAPEAAREAGLFKVPRVIG